MINKNSPLPLYHQLKKILEDRIDSGEWLPGMQAPSERELCEQFQISRITVRRALAELVAEGRLTRQQGLGTFIAAPRIEQRLARLTGFSQDMQAQGKRPGARILQFERLPAPPAVARCLRIAVEDPVVLVKRLRLTNNEPLAIENAYLTTQKCPDLEEENLEDRSLYRLLIEKYNLIPTRAEQQLEAISCPSGEARLLGVRKGAPVLHIFRVTYQQDGQPFEYTESYYRGDRYIFHAELSNHALLPVDSGSTK